MSNLFQLRGEHQRLHEMAADRIIDLESRLENAKERIADMLKGDDGQAWKEAEKFMAIEEGKA
jgi:hypothetical protein